MKLCFSTLGCTDWELEDILKLAEQYDIHALEIRGIGGVMDNRKIPALSPSCEATTRALFAKYQVAPRVLGTSCAFHAPDKLQDAIEEGMASIDIAARLDIPYIRVFGNRLLGDTPEEKEQCCDRVADGIAQLCRYAANTSVRVLLEVHGDYTTVQTMGAITERLKDYANFGLIWDIAHTSAYGDNWREFYTAFRHLIYHVHIKDHINSTPKVLTMIGEGELPIAAIAHGMHEDGFDGCFSLEWEKKWHPNLPDLPPALDAFVKILN